MHPEDVTILVPTKNEAKGISAFLESLPPPVQLVVVDASTDDTPRIIREQRPHNTLVLREQSNVTLARQHGAACATTPWLLFTDADVSFASDYFTQLLACGDSDAFYGPKLSRDDYIRYYAWMARAAEWSHRLGVPAASGSNLLLSRRAFDGCGGFDLRLACNEDSEIAWRIKRRGFRISFKPELVVYARDHRRLRRGSIRKTLHSVSRCTLLYCNLMPDRWRGGDWGYWSGNSDPTKS